MNRLRVLAILALIALPFASFADGARVVKVLPHFLDPQGRHTLSPSLFERDAYQALLRKNPAQRSAVRFDVQCKGIPADASAMVIVIEVRGSKSGAAVPIVLEQAVQVGGLIGSWTPVVLRGEAFEKCGDVGAWRATLWQGDQLVSELKSFLW